MYASDSEPLEEKYSTVSKAKPSDLREMKDSGEWVFFWLIDTVKLGYSEVPGANGFTSLYS